MIDDSMIVKSIHLYLYLYLARSHPNLILIPTHGMHTVTSAYSDECLFVDRILIRIRRG